MKAPKASTTGFTLVEIVITLLIAGVLGATLYQYMGSALSGSAVPIKRLKATIGLQQVVENVVGDFEQRNPSVESDWTVLRSDIGAVGTEQVNTYGAYRVVRNEFIRFDGAGIEAGDNYGTPPDNVLRITLANSLDERLTALLVRPTP
jgi:prepilin-type N-terminal cleavage/methylation domain-containing protein